MKNLKGKAILGTSLVYLILLGVMNLLVFLIFPERNEVFWLSYVFMTLAFVLQAISLGMALKSVEVETMFFGIPLISFSVYYLGAALVIGLIFMIFQGAPFALALVLQILLMAAFLIVAIISLLARDTVQAIGDNVKTKVVTLKSTLVDVELLEASATDPDLKNQLHKLAETVKYADPMTTPAIEDVENRIRARINQLRIEVENAQVQDAIASCKALEMLYLERNKKLALSK